MANLTVELYEKLKPRIGEEGARILIEFIETKIEKQTVTKEDLIEVKEYLEKKMLIEVKEYLEKKMLETKEYLEKKMLIEVKEYLEKKIFDLEKKMLIEVKAPLEKKIIEVEWRTKLYFILLALLIILTNPKVIEILGRIFGLLIK